MTTLQQRLEEQIEATKLELAEIPALREQLMAQINIEVGRLQGQEAALTAKLNELENLLNPTPKSTKKKEG